MRHLLILSFSLLFVLTKASDFSSDSAPWYAPIIQMIQAKLVDYTCTQDCTTTLDCSTGLSCFHATTYSKGCCLKALKPNETGCIIEDQCKQACESTICDKSQFPSRCLCEKGRHFLFNKCCELFFKGNLSFI
ncbi:unnamed protein product [Caenorhabditis angaria]|uniref:Uncharacterized protein n=1 Tax=Caenorhabditis angaria TaxID=860376 RepID=A0A9P1MYP9_9PELO|nr:unnamed protein product [Caenorhabditis angaria]